MNVKKGRKGEIFLSSSSTLLLLKGKRRLKIHLYDSHEQNKDGGIGKDRSINFTKQVLKNILYLIKYNSNLKFVIIDDVIRISNETNNQT